MLQAEQSKAKKPKVEQPKGHLKMEQHQPDHQTKAKEGGVTKALEDGSTNTPQGGSKEA